MPRKRKKYLLIDVKIPDENGFRMKLTGKEGEMSEEALASWVPVCERMHEMISEHFAARRAAANAPPTTEPTA